MVTSALRLRWASKLSPPGSFGTCLPQQPEYVTAAECQHTRRLVDHHRWRRSSGAHVIRIGGGVDDVDIDSHRFVHACVGMVSKSRSETLHVLAKTLARLDDRATDVLSTFLTGALQHVDAGAGAGGSARQAVRS